MIRLERLSIGFRRGGAARPVLRDLSLTLPDRDIALIGRNGAGKSTLLRLIAGTLRPDRGRVLTDRRISWPLGFSGAFHPALTGAQNARFVARVYGRDTAALEARVAAFAELGPQFRAPVGGYSSGMRARLAVAVSLAVGFDVYLVDEIIGVGDAAFRQKCLSGFRQRLGAARVLMVSHNALMLRRFCEAGLVLEHGRLTYYPDLEDALAAHAANLSPHAA